MPVQYTEYSAGPSTRANGQESSSGNDYSSYTKEELQTVLENRGLPKTGNKPELIARLEEADSA